MEKHIYSKKKQQQQQQPPVDIALKSQFFSDTTQIVFQKST